MGPSADRNDRRRGCAIHRLGRSHPDLVGDQFGAARSIIPCDDPHHRFDYAIAPAKRLAASLRELIEHCSEYIVRVFRLRPRRAGCWRWRGLGHLLLGSCAGKVRLVGCHGFPAVLKADGWFGGGGVRRAGHRRCAACSVTQFPPQSSDQTNIGGPRPGVGASLHSKDTGVIAPQHVQDRMPTCAGLLARATSDHRRQGAAIRVAKASSLIQTIDNHEMFGVSPFLSERSV